MSHAPEQRQKIIVLIKQNKIRVHPDFLLLVNAEPFLHTLLALLRILLQEKLPVRKKVPVVLNKQIKGAVDLSIGCRQIAHAFPVDLSIHINIIGRIGNQKPCSDQETLQNRTQSLRDGPVVPYFLLRRQLHPSPRFVGLFSFQIVKIIPCTQAQTPFPAGKIVSFLL